MVERTFTFVKPEHVPIQDVVYLTLDYLLQDSFTVQMQKTMDKVPEELAQAHYAEHEGKVYYPFLVKQLSGKPVVLRIYEGENIIERVNLIIGVSDPAQADPRTIRSIYSKETIAEANIDGRSVANAIHRSDSVESAEQEIALWKQYL